MACLVSGTIVEYPNMPPCETCKEIPSIWNLDFDKRCQKGYRLRFDGCWKEARRRLEACGWMLVMNHVTEERKDQVTRKIQLCNFNTCVN